MEALNLTALITSVIAMIIVFIKTIRKCKCGKGGIEIERRDEIDRHHSFIIDLLKSIKTNFTPRRFLEKKPSLEENNTTMPSLEITDKTTTADIAREFNLVPKTGIHTVSVPIRELLEQNSKKQKKKKNSANNSDKTCNNITPFVINRK